MMDFLKKDNEIPKESDRVIENMRMIAQAQDEAGNHKKAFEMYKAIVEIKEDGDCRHNIAMIYMNKSNQTEESMAAVFYWLDKAVTSGITNAQSKLEQIMSFAKNKGIDMSRVFGRIVVSCKDGSEDIPKDITKVAYWANVALNGMEK